MNEIKKKQFYKGLRATTEFLLAKKKHLCDFKFDKPIKIKLVAIAKNESAYLPEWIFHHLYFGFDQIDVHVNRTTDNTLKVLNKVAQLPNVSIKNADKFFSTYKGNPQSGLYKKVLKETKGSEFTHVCFLDIDEFWTPMDLKSTIHDCVKSSGKFDVISFEWINKVEPNNTFGPALSENITYQRAPQLKSIIDVRCPVIRANPHTLVNPYLIYKNGNGEKIVHDNTSFSRVPRSDLQKPVKPYFILHRFYRSEFEYIAILGRGRPNFPEQGNSKIKSNRNGYADIERVETFEFDPNALGQYREFINEYYEKYIESKEFEAAREYIRQGYSRVLSIVRNSEKAEMATIKKAFANVRDAKALTAYNQFLDKVN
ncbi:glycosyltransferase family 2 protein [Alteromonas gracilis]|uniref:glycosyltransferase family 2 protein n=1 Tax=Alteromonas gracilis TaxID=1479524 RepID=UPI003735269C